MRVVHTQHITNVEEASAIRRWRKKRVLEGEKSLNLSACSNLVCC